jgi:hypothetical protein
MAAMAARSTSGDGGCTRLEQASGGCERRERRQVATAGYVCGGSTKRWHPDPAREVSSNIQIPQRLDEEVVGDPARIYTTSYYLRYIFHYLCSKLMFFTLCVQQCSACHIFRVHSEKEIPLFIMYVIAIKMKFPNQLPYLNPLTTPIIKSFDFMVAA